MYEKAASWDSSSPSWCQLLTCLCLQELCAVVSAEAQLNVSVLPHLESLRVSAGISNVDLTVTLAAFCQDFNLF